MSYCPARSGEHSCKLLTPRLFDGDSHPGDGSKHECHCEEYAWQDDRYLDGTRPQISHYTMDGEWLVGLYIWSAIGIGPILVGAFGKKFLHFPFRWILWWKR